MFVSHLFYLTTGFNPCGLSALPLMAAPPPGWLIAGTGLSAVAGAIPGVPCLGPGGRAGPAVRGGDHGWANESGNPSRSAMSFRFCTWTPEGTSLSLAFWLIWSARIYAATDQRS